VKKNDSVHDCVIIGGGPAGLTCAIFLGRYRRRVVVIDSGKPRNYASHGIHGFLGQHSIKPAELLRRGREEASAVGVVFQDAIASGIEKVGDHFEVTTSEGVLKSRRIVLAYGIRDKFPDLTDFDQYYGKSIFHCPDCDAYEFSDQPLAVVGTGKRVAGLALKLLQWSEDVTLLTNGEDNPHISPEVMSKLEAEGVKTLREGIVDLQGPGGKLEAVILDNGTRLPAAAIFFSIGTERSCHLAEDLGCEVFDDIPCITVDEYKETTVKGVYAIGDLVAGSQLAITSAADGAICAIALNKSLLPPARRV
jgi:thioredoxin reductase